MNILGFVILTIMRIYNAATVLEWRMFTPSNLCIVNDLHLLSYKYTVLFHTLYSV